MPILHIRDENGNFVPITSIKGADGKSAYEQAKEGGYVGTEEEFVAFLNGLTDSEIAAHYADFSNPHKVTAEQIGLENVDNTADTDKPVSVATQKELDKKIGNSIQTYVATFTSSYEDDLVTYTYYTVNIPQLTDGIVPYGYKIAIIPSENSLYVSGKRNLVYINLNNGIDILIHFPNVDNGSSPCLTSGVPLTITNLSLPPTDIEMFPYAAYWTVNNVDLSEYPKIETGSYVGTGYSGADYPNSLSFGFTPKIVFLAKKAGGKFGTLIYGISYMDSDENNKLTWSGNTVSWYWNGNLSDPQSSTTTGYQFNTLDTEYDYIAIG